MTSMEDRERTCLVSDKDSKKYSLVMNSTNLLQNNANKENHNMELVASGSWHHCHDHAMALENRKKEQQQASRKLYMASIMCLIFMITEVIGGRIAGSLAVMMDAAHMSVDLMSFLISLFSLWLSSKRPSKRLTYGWYRAEILGAFLSMITIWAVTGVLTYYAVMRLLHPHYEIKGMIMLITSGCAVIANIILSLMLYQTGHSHAPNSHHASYQLSKHKPEVANASVKAAFVHAVGDLLQSISVLISALIIFIEPKYKMADPICTFVFSIFVLGTTINILWDILRVLMEGTPKGLSYDSVKEKILAMDKVKSVHNLHLWSLTMNQTILTAHIVTVHTADEQQILKEMTEALYDAYNFHTVTLQIEPEGAQKPECIFCQDLKD